MAGSIACGWRFGPSTHMPKVRLDCRFDVASCEGGFLLRAEAAHGIRPWVVRKTDPNEYESVDEIGSGERHLERYASTE